MEKIVFVTGNYGKYISAKRHFEENEIEMDYYDCDLEELSINDIEAISKDKAKQAYNKLKRPVIVTDSGFYIEDYPNNPGYPGAFAKRSGISSNVSKLLDTMKNSSNRNCYFRDCLTFYDGKDCAQFFGISRGTLSDELRGEKNKSAKSNLWYVFIPNNYEKTLAEMTEYELSHKKDCSTSPITQFIDWYKFNILNTKYLVKSKK